MICVSCDRTNREGARYCRYCGTTLQLRCASCGTGLEHDSLFCDSCGSRLPTLGDESEEGSDDDDDEYPEPAPAAEAPALVEQPVATATLEEPPEAEPEPEPPIEFEPQAEPEPEETAAPQPEPQAEPDPEQAAAPQPEPEVVAETTVDLDKPAAPVPSEPTPDTAAEPSSDPTDDAAADALATWEPSGSWVPDNLASKVADQALHRLLDHDWDAFTAMHSPRVLVEDRRAGLLWAGTGRDAALKRAGDYASADRRVATMRLATWGDRLALVRQILTRGDEHHWESQRLVLTAIDERGSITDVLFFDVHDLRTGMRALSERFRAGEGREWTDILTAQELLDAAYDKRDWTAFGKLHHANVFLMDHRMPGTRAVLGREAVVAHEGEALGAGQHPVLTEIIAIEADRVLTRHHLLTSATHEAPAEPDSLTIAVWRGGRLKHYERFGVRHMKAALERFDRLGLLGPTADLGVDNRCAEVVRTSQQALDAGDAKALAAVYHAKAIIEDRRGADLKPSRGRKAMTKIIESYVAAGCAAAHIETIGVRGDRLALVHRWLRPAERGSSGHEELIVHEIDEHGLIVASIAFAPGDVDAAFDELDARYAATGSSAHLLQPGLREMHRERDWDALIATLGDGFEMTDHRRKGWGHVESAEDLTELFRTQAELSSDVRMWDVAVYAVAPHGSVTKYRLSHVLLDGGVVDADFIMVVAGRRDGLRIEIFENDQLDDAVIRLNAMATEDAAIQQAS